MQRPTTAEAGRAVTHTRALGEIERGDASRVGSKAANLGALLRRGFPVPPGVVIPASVDDAQLEAAAAEALAVLGDGPLAVRSSAVAEDLGDASFAGQYETVLGVRGAEAVLAAVRRVRATARDARVRAYREAHGPAGDSGMAVLLMPMVAAEVSGVAFTAHPLHGDREETVVTATAGLAEQLVGGEATGEQWIVRAGRAVRDRRAPMEVLDESRALAVAALARRVEDQMGGAPQDIEWAWAGGQLHLLQARPMTALPEPARWEAPGPGGWTRNFRLGEWLTEPVTPLCATWLLPRLEETFASEQRRHLGVDAPRPLHILVNGWYFYSPFGSGSAWRLLGALRRPRFMLGFLLMSRWPELVHRSSIGPATDEWRDRMMPRYRRLVAEAERSVDSADDAALAAIVDAVADMAGEFFLSMTLVAGHAWKMESLLADLYRQHLQPTLGGNHQALVAGLVQPAPLEAHAIVSLDWFRPTVGELGPSEPPPTSGYLARVAERELAEKRCREALPARLRPRFESLLHLAQHYARVREEQSSLLTLGWPVARRALHHLGASAVRRGVIERPEDIHFLERGEVDGSSSRISQVAARRTQWARNRRLTPPLVVGTLPRFITAPHEDGVARIAGPREVPDGSLQGMPASAGRATGVARVLLDLADADRLAPGEILVTSATTPAWTALFGRAAGVVTDGGSLVAHASLVAREYGIPAVVALGDATRRIRDGQRITIDGTTGLLTVHP